MTHLSKVVLVYVQYAPKSSISNWDLAPLSIHLWRVLRLVQPKLRYFWTHQPTNQPWNCLLVQKSVFFWFWDGTENAKTVFLARALKLTNVHRVDTPPALNREKCKLKTKEIWKRKKLRKSEKENWGNLKCGKGRKLNCLWKRQLCLDCNIVLTRCPLSFCFVEIKKGKKSLFEYFIPMITFDKKAIKHILSDSKPTGCNSWWYYVGPEKHVMSVCNAIREYKGELAKLSSEAGGVLGQYLKYFSLYLKYFSLYLKYFSLYLKCFGFVLK